MMPTGKASGNAVLAKARALYGSRLRADDYRRLMACRTMTELAAALKEYPLYSEALAEVNPQYARRVQLENLLRQSLYTRYDSLCRYDRSAGSKVYEYFTLCCEVDELTAAMRCLDAGRPGDYLFRLPGVLAAALLHRPLRAGQGHEFGRYPGRCGRYAVGKGPGTAAERQAGPRSDRPGRAASAGLPPPRTGGAGPR